MTEGRYDNRIRYKLVGSKAITDLDPTKVHYLGIVYAEWDKETGLTLMLDKLDNLE